MQTIDERAITNAPSAATCSPPGVTDPRALEAFEIRFDTATTEAERSLPKHTTNGDEERYTDKSATYSKGLLQKGFGVVDPAAFLKFRAALGSADGSTAETGDFEAPGLIGGGRTLNGPLAAFAFSLVGADSRRFGDDVVPAAPALASPEYAAELIELYWGSLLRDVEFADYDRNNLALAAAAELSSLPAYAGPRDGAGQVTTKLLFRGGAKVGNATLFPGQDVGPYLSQFCINPTMLGAQPIDQKVVGLAPGVDYMTDLDVWQAVQNGSTTNFKVHLADHRFMHDGRSLASFTHVDELYQAYFVAYLAMNTLKIPKNPGSPYAKLKNQNGFGTFGGPDFAATLAAVAREALNAVWYQKWVVHLRHRPESGGGIVHLMKTKKGTVDGTLHQSVLDSQALHASFNKYGSYLLSQAFPEGSPAHPAYPTGHGTVGGACITILKFFYDGNAPIPSPMTPTQQGQTLERYDGADASAMTVNGELHKIAHNVSFGHGIHAGIHWRSDTDASIRLGEAVAVAYLRDQAKTYRESFKVDITLVDGTKATIQN